MQPVSRPNRMPGFDKEDNCQQKAYYTDNSL